MELLISKNFNGTALDCYKAENAQDDFWATREQIGRLLGYKNPDMAVKNIHARNTDRLNKFSTKLRMSQVEGSRTITRDVIVYNFKGLLEICRFSNQPKANDVMDFLWNIADEIRRKGFYATLETTERILEDPDTLIKILTELKNERARAKELAKQAEENKPKVIFAEAVETSDDCILVSGLAKILTQKGIKIGEKRLYEWFRSNGFLMSCPGERWNRPKQCYVEQGLFEVKKVIITSGSKPKVRHTTKVTGKGQIYFVNGFMSGKFRV